MNFVNVFVSVRYVADQWLRKGLEQNTVHENAMASQKL